MTGGAALRAAPARPPSDELTLDQLLAEPIVQQLMRRDRIDEPTIRHLLQETASARRASSGENELKADDPRSIVRLLHDTAQLWWADSRRKVAGWPR